jgi:thioredoxin reductase
MNSEVVMTNEAVVSRSGAGAGAAVGDAVWDVVVVGGGAAGLSAALALARARRRVLVIDAGRPRNAPAEGVHVFLTRDGTPPDELMRLGRADVEKFGGVIRPGIVVSATRLRAMGAPLGARFAVALADGSEVRARRLVVTTGVVDELPDVAGLRERWGRGVIHCPYCHGWEVRDEAIGVLGTGPRAVFQALLFRQWSERVTLLLHEAPEPTEEEWEQLAARGIEVVTGTVVRVLGSERGAVAGSVAGALSGLLTGSLSGSLSGVELEGGRTIALRALVVATRMVADEGPGGRLLTSLGAVVAEHPSGAGTYVESDAMGCAAPGVWVAGNVASPMAQVITAAAAGVAVGAAANNDLMAEELAEAVAVRASRG